MRTFATAAGQVALRQRTLREVGECVGAAAGGGAQVAFAVAGRREACENSVALTRAFEVDLSVANHPPAIRRARSDEFARLIAISRAADALFAEHGIALPPGDASELLAAAEAVLVVGDPALGFSALSIVDSEAHLAEIAVDPAHGRRGHGTRLLLETCRAAAADGYRAMTLTTFRDLPFNAPWYARYGFSELPPAAWGPQLREQWAAEIDLRVRPRVMLRRDLTDHRADSEARGAQPAISVWSEPATGSGTEAEARDQ